MKKQSTPSSSASTSKEQKESNGFSLMNDDLLHNILSRLPATSVASAACASKALNAACNRLLSRPKIASALSLNPRPLDALREVFDKVMSEPIRPHFAVAFLLSGDCHKSALQFLVKKLGSTTPIIIISDAGIIGRDALTDELREVKYDYADGSSNPGVVLTVGFVPGLKVEAIPLLRPEEAPQGSTIDKFVMDIKSYTSSVSGCTSPLAIIMTGKAGVDQKPIIEKLDYAMPMETVIVGNEGGEFHCRSGDVSRNVCSSRKCYPDAVALVFAKDRNKAHGMGDIEFHFALSNGFLGIGPRYKAASVKNIGRTTWLTAKREGQQEILDGEHMLEDISNEMENLTGGADLFIGVTRRRNCSVGSEKPRLMTSLALHVVRGGDEQYLYVDGLGIRTGDYFQFYCSDPKTALLSCRKVSSAFRNWKLDWDSKSCLSTRAVVSANGKKEALGGFIFSCWGRGESFFGQPNVDSSPFLENFLGVPQAGLFCWGQTGRGYASLTADEGQEEGIAHRHLHRYSTVYLVISYTPPAEH